MSSLPSEFLDGSSNKTERTIKRREKKNGDPITVMNNKVIVILIFTLVFLTERYTEPSPVVLTEKQLKISRTQDTSAGVEPTLENIGPRDDAFIIAAPRRVTRCKPGERPDKRGRCRVPW
ncbi:uncharacterized protein LOC135168918 [Diachasmimorpha longicaudata]|uniref:uncharacterized protein LOC135168918 n=1 Tax=Diachasmimorpha longicaudata TaxID=58733 RepID=UPI0030B8E09A